MARATSAKPAWAGCATTARRRATVASRLVMCLLNRDLWDPELSFEGGQAVDVDGAVDVDDGELARLGGDDDQAGDALAAHVGVDVHVLFLLAADGDERLPR